jgi:predicted TIM-barrel fold metal-dependent hydrolase
MEAIIMNRSRRAFLGTTAAALAATRLEARAEEAIPIIDTHQHLWDLGKFRLPWVKKGAPLARNFLLSDYRQAARGLNIVKTVYMEVDVDPVQQDAEAEYVIALCKQKDSRMAGAVISGRPASDGFAKYIRRYKDSPFIKGVRQVLHGPGTPAGYCLDRTFIASIRLLGDLGLRFDLCMRPGELSDAVKLIDACPGTRFVLDHCGNAPVQAKDLSGWKKDMETLAGRKNVVGKVSGIVAGAAEGWKAEDLAPVIEHTLKVFGPDRVMFAGDWPVCTRRATLRQWVEALKMIVKDRPREQQKKLFHDNAVAFYGLK